jgi:hypothetical protein
LPQNRQKIVTTPAVAIPVPVALVPKLDQLNLMGQEGQFMESAIQFPTRILSREGPPERESGLFSTESVLNLQKLIFAGSPLSDDLTNIAQLVEPQADGMLCTIWLPHAHCDLGVGLGSTPLSA